MTKNRLRYSKGKDLLQHAHKSSFNGEFVFPAEAARKIARNLKKYYGKLTYKKAENPDPVLTKALELEGIRFRTSEEEHAWENATPEERGVARAKHQAASKRMIADGNCVELYAPADQPFHAPGKEQPDFFEDITLSL